MEPTPASPAIEYAPRHAVLGRKILGLALLGAAWFALCVATRAREHDWAYFRDVLPVHLLLAGMIALYLVYLSFALFRTLGADYRIRLTDAGLVVRGEGAIRELHWEDIRRVRFGDLYLKLETSQGRIEVPFIPREVQREIFRRHHRAVGLRPDPGRFLARR
jgi:hypothetical protein